MKFNSFEINRVLFVFFFFFFFLQNLIEIKISETEKKIKRP